MKKYFSIVIKWFLVYLQSGEHQSPENDLKLSDLVEKNFTFIIYESICNPFYVMILTFGRMVDLKR